MSLPILKVEGLTLASQGGMIVNNLSFQISPGEIVALTGKSGSGKTSIALSLLNLLPAGLHIQNGFIHWQGSSNHELSLPADALNWKQLRGTHIGYTQQDVYGAFDPVMKMGDQMLMVIKERGARVGIDVHHELKVKMEEVGLHETERLLDSYPHQLSGGQLQRCQIAMAIVIHPQLLIADEPTSAIDKINQLELLDVFSMLRARYNMAILCITHEEAVVRYLADREIQLDNLEKIFHEKGYVSVSEHETISTESYVLEAKGLEYTHSYGGMMYKQGATVGPLDFELRRGACLGIVGESGSGKSTLAQLLVGLLEPLKGHLFLNGKEFNYHNSKHLQELRSKVQLVMQDGRGSLHPHFSVRKMLNEIIERKQSGIQINDAEVVEALHNVGLNESMLHRRAAQLSGGECLRVSIARALLMHPEVLICDESTSSLDSSTRDGIVDLLFSLRSQYGLALIFISHDEQMIRRVADEVMVLSEGKVVEKGVAADVIGYPTHPVTKRIFSTGVGMRQKGSL
jgi:peptide/nickel transport system ATP-binding protein